MLSCSVRRLAKNKVLEVAKSHSGIKNLVFFSISTLKRNQSLVNKNVLTSRKKELNTVKTSWCSVVKRFNETATNEGTEHMRPRASNTIDEEDVKHFSRLANRWWTEDGEFEALHRLNQLRVPLIRDALLREQDTENCVIEPLKGLKLLDVGSGGGILAEPLARLGAFVVGVDASEENIKVAQAHAEQDLKLAKNLKYIHASVEDLIRTEEESFDGVVASEIIEHVFNAPDFISSCCKLTKPGGSVFFTTINKTYLSYFLTVSIAENVLQIVPKGSHDWEKFISPSELQTYLVENNVSTKLIHGMCYNPVARRWSWNNDVSVNYAIHAVKGIDHDTYKGSTTVTETVTDSSP